MDGTGSQASVETAPGGAPVILLAEDDPADEMLTVRVLRRARIANEVTVVRDGVEALDYLLGIDRDANARPACVLLDVTLPRVDGLEILKRLHADHRTTRLPILMLVPDTDDRDGLVPRNLGTCRVARTPLGLTEFITAARELGLSWLIVGDPAAAHEAPLGHRAATPGTRFAIMPTRLTTGDRCPACNGHDIERVDATSARSSTRRGAVAPAPPSSFASTATSCGPVDERRQGSGTVGERGTTFVSRDGGRTRAMRDVAGGIVGLASTACSRRRRRRRPSRPSELRE